MSLTNNDLRTVATFISGDERQDVVVAYDEHLWKKHDTVLSICPFPIGEDFELAASRRIFSISAYSSESDTRQCTREIEVLFSTHVFIEGKLFKIEESNLVGVE